MKIVTTQVLLMLLGAESREALIYASPVMGKYPYKKILSKSSKLLYKPAQINYHFKRMKPVLGIVLGLEVLIKIDLAYLIISAMPINATTFLPLNFHTHIR